MVKRRKSLFKNRKLILIIQLKKIMLQKLKLIKMIVKVIRKKVKKYIKKRLKQIRRAISMLSYREK